MLWHEPTSVSFVTAVSTDIFGNGGENGSCKRSSTNMSTQGLPLPALGASVAHALRAELSTLQLADAQQVAAALALLQRRERLDLPLPGRGSTLARFNALVEVGAADLSLARLVEGHCDALAILAELDAPANPGTYGVWAADPPDVTLTARASRRGYQLQGRKRYASGASSLTRALVTARTPAGVALFDVELSATGIQRVEHSWPAVGMAHSDSLDVQFNDVFVPNSAAIGQPGRYLERAGFWHGAVGVAACWFGGAVGCARMLHERCARVPCDEHALAHVGAVSAICSALQQVLANAAAAIDGDPDDTAHRARKRALLVRASVERGCQDVLTHTGRASGSSALVFDARHARRAADLPVYLRQHHAERDLVELGRLTLAEAAWH